MIQSRKNIGLLSRQDLDNICSYLEIDIDDIQELYVNPGRSANNENFVVKADGKSYLYRVPGKGSSLFCDRKKEAQAYLLLKPYKITDEVLFLDEKTGSKLSVYYEGSHIPHSDDNLELQDSMKLLRYLHELDLDFPFHESLFDRMEQYYDFAVSVGGEKYFLKEYYLVREHLSSIKEEPLTSDLEKTRLTHGDASINNIIFTNEHSHPLLIDLEFFAKSDMFSDIATFSVDADFREKDIFKILDYYLERPSKLEEQYHVLKLCCVTAMMWYGWAAYKLAVEEEGAELYMQFRNDYQAYILDMINNINVYRREFGLSNLSL